MEIKTIILIASIPLLLALLAFRYRGWYDYVKNRKYRGGKLKKYADKMENEK
ncbi:hypothetical protein [Pedobacter frigiditerrae]|uniref:hypothetical protein n=1 Tax=Pedobacter frigiditerrae TaxID=2530452 RepID=UPI00292DFB4B|nr:hypothetical protein [Pedobacter frigiditerrae]